MTLCDILTEAIRRARRGQYVIVARKDDGPHGYQLRFVYSANPSVFEREPKGILIESRRWMDGSESTPSRGTRHGHVGWAHWSAFLGFSVPAVLANDWDFVDARALQDDAVA